MKDFVDREKEREIENKYDTACKTNTGNLIRSKQWTCEIKLEVEYCRLRLLSDYSRHRILPRVCETARETLVIRLCVFEMTRGSNVINVKAANLSPVDLIIDSLSILFFPRF